MKLHLGCGKVFIPGFVHIDVDDYPHIDHRAAVERLPMIPDDSVELVYACHVLEHFPASETVRVLKEWRRVLSPGGVLRLSVPDFGAITERYANEGDLSEVMGLLFGRQDRLYNIHRTVFDDETLSVKLYQAGFAKVRRCNWSDTEHAHIHDFSQAHLPRHPGEPFYPNMPPAEYFEGMPMSLNMEAVK